MRMSRLIAAMTVGLALACHGRAEDPRKPNVVIVLADDMGYGDFSCYGHQRIKSPNLDKFATQGMRFVQGYAACYRDIGRGPRQAESTERLPTGLLRRDKEPEGCRGPIEIWEAAFAVPGIRPIKPPSQ
jgi:hypothetical protein